MMVINRLLERKQHKKRLVEVFFPNNSSPPKYLKDPVELMKWEKRS
jgi:hypothetical protein